MSLEKYDDRCAGCRPAMIDLSTHKVLPDDSPRMKCILAVWAETTFEEREAWHRFTCLNSRAQPDMRVAKDLAVRFQSALKAIAG